VGTRFDSGREVAVVGGCCFCLGRCVCAIYVVVFFLWGLLDTCPFLGSLWITGVCCGLIVGLTLWGTYLGGAWVSVQPERGGGVFCVWLFR